MKLRLYNVLDQYINYLMQFDKKVLSSKEDDRLKDRKYLGTVLPINDLKYFIPLSSPKDSDYQVVNGEIIIRKNITPIMRIVVKDESGKDELKGTLKFNNMIPIPDIALVYYDVDTEADEDYKILVLKEISFIKINEDKIIKNAKVIHNQKMNNYEHIGYLNATVNFKLLEQKCKEYESAQESLIKPYQQIAAVTSELSKKS